MASMSRTWFFLAASTAFLAASSAAWGSVDIKTTTTCLDKAQLAARLEMVLREHSRSREVDLMLTVDDRQDGDHTQIDLRGITGDGDLLLDRRFALSASDCQSATELLATIVDRFVQELPLEKWTLGSPPEPMPPPPPQTPVAGRSVWVNGRLAASLGLLPVGAAFEGTVVSDVGNRTHALGVEVSVIGSYPASLGHGKFYTILVTGGAGWRYSPTPWLARVGVRAGSLMAAGTGFVVNDRQWLPWVELVAGAGRTLGPVTVIASGAISPYRHAAVTSDKALSKQISSLRLSLGVEIPIWGPES
jgi:hypothetical protein